MFKIPSIVEWTVRSGQDIAMNELELLRMSRKERGRLSMKVNNF